MFHDEAKSKTHVIFATLSGEFLRCIEHTSSEILDNVQEGCKTVHLIFFIIKIYFVSDYLLMLLVQLRELAK